MQDVTRHDDHERDDLTPAQRELADALRGLSPAAPNRINRDRLLFEAGAAAARRSVFRWRAAAAVLVLGNAVLMTVALRSSSGNMGGTTIVSAPTTKTTTTYDGHNAPSFARSDTRPADANERPLVTRAAWDRPWSPARLLGQSPTPPAKGGYVSVRDAVLREGLSALPAPPGRPARDEKPLNIRELLGT
jgi:hypothetical protein